MNKWNPEDYHNNSSFQLKWAKELIATLDFKGNERILDIGCGDGKITALIASYVPNGFVLGIDNSQEMIDFAKSSFPTSQFDNLSFRRQDATQLDFHNEFDIILSFTCLHWVSNQVSLLQGIKNSIKNNGKVLLQMLGKNRNALLRNTIEKVIYSEKWSTYFQDFAFPTRFYSDYEYKDLLSSVGLEAKRIELIPKDVIYQGREELKGSIRTVAIPSYIWRVPLDLQEDIIDEIVDTYIISNPLDSKGFAHVSKMSLEVEATKIA